MSLSSRSIIVAALLAGTPAIAMEARDRPVVRERLPITYAGRVFGRGHLAPAVIDGAYVPARDGSFMPVAALPPDLGPFPRPCAPPPMVIRIGQGVAHPARTRVVYGLPGCAY